VFAISRRPFSATSALLFLILIVSIARIVLVANLPLDLLVQAGHDDGYFIKAAMHLASGRWFGPYDQITLIKGPGYPMFLAAASYTGLPVTIAHALFQVVACWVSAWAVLRLTKSHVLAGAAFLLLALMPVGFHPAVQRVIRDQIYWGQALILFSLFATMYFAPPHARAHRLLLGAAAGGVFGWAWLTREEGIWYLPGLAFLLIGAVAVARCDKRTLVNLAQSSGAAVAAFLLVNAAYYTGNKIAYGSFVGVDFKESGFAAAVDALNSVTVGEPTPYVPVPLSVRREVARISPTFAQLEPDLSAGRLFAGWSQYGCRHYPSSCGDYAGGWFVWALRDVAAMHGFYKSPKTASRKFRRIADDIEAACSDGRLTCRSTIFSFVPRMTTDQWRHTLPNSILDVTAKVGLWAMRQPHFNAHPADLPLPRFTNAWAFLNFPLITNGNGARELVVSGWFDDTADAEWPTFKAYDRSGRELKQITTTRLPSPDIQKLNERAKFNRFKITVSCPSNCVLAAVRDGRPEIRTELRKGRVPAQAATATLFIDKVENRHDMRVLPRHRAASYVRAVLVHFYRDAMPALLIVGVLATLLTFAMAVVARAMPPATWLVAIAAWAMVAARIAILGLVDASSFPGAAYHYTAPASYLAALACVLAIAALAQMIRPTIFAARTEAGNEAVV
jgi:hypothetical protein